MSAAPAVELREYSAYGKLAFDRFVLVHWDYSTPSAEDQNQWNELARKWLRMDHTARSPHWMAVLPLERVDRSDPRLPAQEQIDRVLAPHQTIAERNIAQDNEPCIYMRTCYEPSLASAFEEMTRNIRNDVYESYRLFDNEALYGNVGPDLEVAYLRMPQLPDTVQYCGYPETEDLPFEDDPPEDENKLRLYEAAMKARGMMYLMDEEALKRKMLKLIWTDLGGNIVWWNWLKPSDTQSFEGLYYGKGYGLHELLQRGDGNSHYDNEGAVIEYQ
ncbi:hypothetical protein FB567DRAFT_526903 [Paraphoma chrysanthemicola]|uniref:Uncharacterized protein n=1 Tax=Paraphoma chrysanthemicola TaxID=798071 RepID=A0A8K0VYR1_9PLEO|nr:hypothetical protein FB567DRAFT_526903 [Paraphoma chrysanthemicola]